MTVFGQSGGGAKVLALMGMPDAAHLIRRGIDMSGSSTLRMNTAPSVEPLIDEMLRHLGLDRGDPRRLQQVPYDALLNAQAAAKQRIWPLYSDRPIIDGMHVPAAALAPETLALHAEKPLMLGTTRTESTFWLGTDTSNMTITEDELLARFRRQFRLDDQQARTLAAAYREDEPGLDAYGVLTRMSTDALFRVPLIGYAEAKSRASSAPVFMYNFAWPVPVEAGRWLSPHAADIAFAFGNLSMGACMTGGDADAEMVSDHVMTAFSSFARSGDPNVPGLPAWKRYEPEHRATMVFDVACRVEDDHLGAARRANQTIAEQDHFELLGGPLFRGLAT